MIEFIYDGFPNRIVSVITNKYPHIGFNTIQKILRKGDVRINGIKVRTDNTVNRGDSIRIYGVDPFKVQIIFENDDIAVFFKPSKIPSQGVDSFEKEVKKLYEGYILCHRLDTNTEGLLLFAKNAAAHNEILKAFKLRGIEKRYVAAAYGIIDKENEFIAYLKKDSEKGLVKIFDTPNKDAEKIITKIKPLKIFAESTILDIELVTGKTHQIRAHLAHIGHPIIGDSKYGLQNINRKYGKSRQMLRAYKLVFHNLGGSFAYLNGLEVFVDISDFLNGFNLK